MLKRDFKEIKKMINDYYTRDFGEDCTINNETLCDNFKNLGLAYTVEDGHEIQISANIPNRIISTYIDKRLIGSDVFPTWKTFKECLNHLDFDEIVFNYTEDYRNEIGEVVC